MLCGDVRGRGYRCVRRRATAIGDGDGVVMSLVVGVVN